MNGNTENSGSGSRREPVLFVVLGFWGYATDRNCRNRATLGLATDQRPHWKGRTGCLPQLPARDDSRKQILLSQLLTEVRQKEREHELAAAIERSESVTRTALNTLASHSKFIGVKTAIG